MEAFELDDKFVRLVMQSKYSGEFMEFLQNLRNQQAKPVDVDATAPEPIDAPVEESPASEAETPVDEAPVNEAPASETETPVAFPEFLFEKIAAETLIGEDKLSCGVSNSLRKVVYILNNEAQIYFWGELFTRKDRVKRLVKLEDKEDFDGFAFHFERKMKCSLDAEFSGLEEALKPYVEANAAELKALSDAVKRRKCEEFADKLLHMSLRELHQCEEVLSRLSRGSKSALTRFCRDAERAPEGSDLRAMLDWCLEELCSECDEALVAALGTIQRVHAVRDGKVAVEQIRQGL